MRKQKTRRTKARPKPSIELTAPGLQASAEWSELLLKASSLSAIPPIVEKVRAYEGPDRGEVLRGIARSLQEDALPLFRALAAIDESCGSTVGSGGPTVGRELQLATLEATSLVRSEEAAEIINPLAAEGADDELRKAARRALERLRSLGVKANVPMGAGIIAEVPQIERFQEALAGAFNGLGQRMVSLAQRIPGHGLAVAQIACDDAHGIYDCALGVARRHEYDALKEGMSADPMHPLSAVPWGYGVHLLREARQLNEASGTPVPESFGEIEAMMAEEKSPAYERSIVYDHLNADEVKDSTVLLADSARLLDLDAFAFWELPRDKVKPLADQLKEAGQGWVVVPEAALQDRVVGLVNNAAETIFDEVTRAKFKRRLEEMAYLVLDSGRAAEARMTLATALALAPGGPGPASIPFVHALIGRSLAALDSTPRAEGEAEESRIVLPFGAAGAAG